MLQRWRGLVAVATVLLMVLAACVGGSEDGGGSDTSNTTEDTTASTATTEPSELDEDFDLLMAATYGDPTNGSFSPDRIDEAIRHRSRHTISDNAAMSPPTGFGHCMNGGRTDPAAVFNLSRVYILDRESGAAAQDADSQFADRIQQNLDAFRAESGLEVDQEANDRPVYSIEPIELLYAEEPTVDQFVLQVNAILAGIEVEQVDVGLDYSFAPSMIYGFAADDPTPVLEGTTSEALAAAQVGADDGHTIWIADYGLPIDSDKNSWSGLIDGEESQENPVSGQPIPAFYAHSVMVASVAGQVAPENPVFVIDATEDVLGTRAITVAALDWGLLRNNVIDSGPGVLNLSFGAYDCKTVADSNDTPLAVSESNSFSAAIDRVLRPYINAMPVVGAAGNDASSTPIYPAALDGVIAVGAVDETVPNTDACLDAAAGIFSWSPSSAAPQGCTISAGTREAPFNNTGKNPTEMRPGVDLIVDYPVVDDTSRYMYLGGFEAILETGRVRVSGTSLSAPFEAACLLPDGSTRC